MPDSSRHSADRSAQDDVAPLSAGGTVMDLSGMDDLNDLSAVRSEETDNDPRSSMPSIDDFEITGEGNGGPAPAQSAPSIDDFDVSGEGAPPSPSAPPAAPPPPPQEAAPSMADLKEQLRRELREELLAEMRADRALSSPEAQKLKEEAAEAGVSLDDFIVLDGNQDDGDDFELAGGAPAPHQPAPPPSRAEPPRSAPQSSSAGGYSPPQGYAPPPQYSPQGYGSPPSHEPPPAGRQPEPSPERPAPKRPEFKLPKPPERKIEKPAPALERPAPAPRPLERPRPEPEPQPTPAPVAAPAPPPPRPTYTPPAKSTYAPPKAKKSSGGGGASMPSFEVPDALKDPKTLAGIAVAVAAACWFLFSNPGMAQGVGWVEQIAAMHKEYEAAAPAGGAGLADLQTRQEALQEEISANLEGALLGGARRTADSLNRDLGRLIQQRVSGGVSADVLKAQEEKFAESLQTNMQKLQMTPQ